MEITVCIGDYCHLNGSEKVIRRFKELIREEKLDAKLEMKGCFCMRRCEEPGVSVQVQDKKYKVDAGNPEAVDTFFHQTITPALGHAAPGGKA